MLNVPDPVIGPPVKPVPVATLVTVPPPPVPGQADLQSLPIQRFTPLTLPATSSIWVGEVVPIPTLPVTPSINILVSVLGINPAPTALSSSTKKLRPPAVV
jgi:hypothetical protein